MEQNKTNLCHGRMVDRIPTLWLCGWIILFTFQRPMEEINRVFKLVDEVCAASLLVVMFLRWNQVCRWLKMGWSKAFVVVLAVFFAVGLAGNLAYQYQPLRYVLQDLLTNAKFYMTLASAMLVFAEGNIQKDTVRKLVYVLSVGIFVVFLFDRFFDIWPSDIRHGISSARLFYVHSTYLAGAMAFLMSILLVFYVPRNLPFILMDLVMMACTMRAKALGGVVIFMVLVTWVILLGKQIKLWHLGFSAAAVVMLAWEKIYLYYFTYTHNARAVLANVSLQILKDYFPIGTGFGTYASYAANAHYSAVYEKYGFLTNYCIPISEAEAQAYFDCGLRNFVYQLKDNMGYVYNELGPNSDFLNDTFWPIILGQTGFLGTVAYLMIMVLLFVKIWKLQSKHRNLFVGAMFILAYVLICSTSEPAFNNAVAIPLAMVLGMCFAVGYRDDVKPKGE